MSAYSQLEAHFREIGIVRSIIGTLNWDRYALMPAGASAARGEQLALLEQWVAVQLADAALPNLLLEAACETLTSAQRTNLVEMSRDRQYACAVPTGLNAALARAGSACEARWREARLRGDFSIVRASFENLLTLTREAAQARANTLAVGTYDALLDHYEPGLRSSNLTLFIDELLRWLPDLVQRMSVSSRPHLPSVPVLAQRSTVPQLLAQIGFDLDQGLIAESLQPCFSDDTPDDVRITLAYDSEQPLSGLFGGLHEMGHSFYERRVAPAWRYQPVGRPRSGGLQESQALLWELHIGASPGFLQWLVPRLQTGFEWSIDETALAVAGRVHDLRGGRLDSGEIGYLLHVILRVQLEQQLVEGALSVSDLPEAWAAKERYLLGHASANPAIACLADIHWYRGLFGYFPSYLVGAATAAQLMAAVRFARPALDEELANGQFTSLIDWLDVNVYQFGSLKSADEILRDATGQPLGDKALRAHLVTRYINETAR